ncbi:MAG: zinc ribbon domain-containing protein [Patescibacteria group bacterium]
MARAKFSVGEKVKVVRLLDTMTNRSLIGMVGTIEEIDQLIGQVNYYVDGHYMHEQELEKVNDTGERERERSQVYECYRCGTSVPQGNLCPQCGAPVQSYM